MRTQRAPLRFCDNVSYKINPKPATILSRIGTSFFRHQHISFYQSEHTRAQCQLGCEIAKKMGDRRMRDVLLNLRCDMKMCYWTWDVTWKCVSRGAMRDRQEVGRQAHANLERCVIEPDRALHTLTATQTPFPYTPITLPTNREVKHSVVSVV